MTLDRALYPPPTRQEPERIASGGLGREGRGEGSYYKRSFAMNVHAFCVFVLEPVFTTEVPRECTPLPPFNDKEKNHRERDFKTENVERKIETFERKVRFCTKRFSIFYR